MSPARPLVIQTEHLDASCAAWLAERCNLHQCAPEEGARFEQLLAEASGLVIRTYTRVDAALLDRAPRLKVVGRAGVGLDNVDLEACASRGVTVVHTPDANTVAVVEYVWALMLDALRPRPSLSEPLALTEWKSLRRDCIASHQLADLTLGLLGFGRVGQRMARIAAAFDTRVIYNDLLEIPESRRSGATPVPLDTLLRDNHVLSLHVDGRATNRHFIDAGKLGRCRDEMLLVNASRGFVIDDRALAAFLAARPAARAVLDVHEPEPFDAESPLVGMANVRLLPHLGAATATAHRNMSWVVRDVWSVLNGEAAEFAAVPATTR
ncbi:MAG: hypothetical protein KDA21_01305 [Phycisphaerales bacterium]|nr:hypothetical protein [Phycisphaerales bacterium]